MRSATLLFYAVATLCLGTMAVFAGGPRMLAALIGQIDLIPPLERAWQLATVFLSLLFLVLAIYIAVADAARQLPDDD